MLEAPWPGSVHAPNGSGTTGNVVLSRVWVAPLSGHRGKTLGQQLCRSRFRVSVCMTLVQALTIKPVVWYANTVLEVVLDFVVLEVGWFIALGARVGSGVLKEVASPVYYTGIALV